MNEANMGFNRFCGPAALSILTGKNTDECADAITRVNGQYRIRGVTVQDLIAAGDRLGLLFNPLIVYGGRSLFFTASTLTKRTNGRYLVLIPKHFVVLEVNDGSIKLCDNHTKTPIDLQNSARLSQKVEAVYSVEEKPFVPLPTIVNRELVVEHLNKTLAVRQVVHYSDGTFKIYQCGNVTLAKDEIGDFAFKLMQLTEKED